MLAFIDSTLAVQVEHQLKRPLLVLETHAFVHFHRFIIISHDLSSFIISSFIISSFSHSIFSSFSVEAHAGNPRSPCKPSYGLRRSLLSFYFWKMFCGVYPPATAEMSGAKGTARCSNCIHRSRWRTAQFINLNTKPLVLNVKCIILLTWLCRAAPYSFVSQKQPMSMLRQNQSEESQVQSKIDQI